MIHVEQETPLQMAEKLCRCRFVQGGRAKQFVRDMRNILMRSLPLSEGQDIYLRDLWRMYRRKIEGVKR